MLAHISVKLILHWWGRRLLRLSPVGRTQPLSIWSPPMPILARAAAGKYWSTVVYKVHIFLFRLIDYSASPAEFGFLWLLKQIRSELCHVSCDFAQFHARRPTRHRTNEIRFISTITKGFGGIFHVWRSGWRNRLAIED